MRALLTAGQWREAAGQLQKLPFQELTGVTIEYSRNKATGEIPTTDISYPMPISIYARGWRRVESYEPGMSPLFSHAMVLR